MDDDGVFCDVDDKVCPFAVMSMTKAGKTPNALWAEAITTKGGGKISR